MNQSFLLDRRMMLAAGLAAGAMPRFALAALPDPLAGVAALSESVQIGAASLDGAYQLVARICRYPGARRSWIWVQLLTPAGFFAYFDHHAPCSDMPTTHEGEAALYETTGPARLRATRSGQRLYPDRCAMEIEARLAATGEPREGEGWIPFSARIEINPARRYSGLLPDRSEMFGTGRMTLMLNGVAHETDVVGQFHEQPQTAPRFAAPYAYASLWGARTGLTIVASARGGGGYQVSDRDTQEYRKVDFPARADRRTITLFSDKGELAIAAEARINQSIPIFGGMWRGQFVTARTEDELFRGVLVDFEQAG